MSGDPQHSRAGAGCCGDGAAVPRGLAGSRSPALGAVWGWVVGFWQRPAASLLSEGHRGHRLGCEIPAESNAASGTQPSALVPCQAPTAAAPLQRFPFQEGFAELLIPPRLLFRPSLETGLLSLGSLSSPHHRTTPPCPFSLPRLVFWGC